MIKILWGYIYSFFKAEILVKELLLREASFNESKLNIKTVSRKQRVQWPDL